MTHINLRMQISVLYNFARQVDFTTLVIRSVSDALQAQSRFVKFYKPTLGPKYVRNRLYNEFITPTTFI